MPENTGNEGGAGFFGRVWARFGEVARNLGIVHEHDVNEALEHQETTAPTKKIGEILVEKGKMTDDHVEAVLQHQRSSSVEAEAAALAAEAPGPKGAAPKKPIAKKAKKKAAKKAIKKPAKKPAGKVAKKTKRAKKKPAK